MTTYIVTLELKTSWWKKFWRFLKIIKQREEFKLTFFDDCFKKGDIINQSGGDDLLILKKI